MKTLIFFILLGVSGSSIPLAIEKIERDQYEEQMRQIKQMEQVKEKSFSENLVIAL